MSRKALDEVRELFQAKSAAVIHNGVVYRRASVGQRCFLVDDGYRIQTPAPERVLLQLHTDGSGTFAHRLHDLADRHGTGEGGPTHLFSDEWLALSVLSGLLQLGKHARDRALAGGTSLLRVTLVPATDARPVTIGDSNFSTPAADREVALSLKTAPITAALDDLADPGPALISTAAMLCDELAQAFGLTELGQFSHDGELLMNWSPAWGHHLKQWAETNNVPVELQ